MNIQSQMQLLEEQAVQAGTTSLANSPSTAVAVAHTMEGMMKAFAVRAAVYMSEQNCPYAEEFDGNDFTATHLLGLVDDEPVATMRIRYFADFAKPERLAVRRQYRRSGIATEVIKYGMELCRQKGYLKLYGHSQARLVPFWNKLGWQAIDTPGFVFSDHQYVEIECNLDPHPDPIVIGKDPMELIRCEGAWKEPGVLDRSAVRPATCPTGHE